MKKEKNNSKENSSNSLPNKPTTTAKPDENPGTTKPKPAHTNPTPTEKHSEHDPDFHHEHSFKFFQINYVEP
jgi:hypothetical protein